ncbi:hypothetical protein B0A49_10489 [Cryomyces minteri]|uniref:Glycosyltransferase 2-like domain-containing protein n=1 Tax=Cryomyces minteri TaxID=331657 RepID=A0A4U0WBM2_9PEZI|nr:hypothetical protein B0A49_10489 [Cryomyces minteri]
MDSLRSMGSMSETASISAKVFVFLFLFRYVRLIVHIIAYFCYKPLPVPANPTVTEKDVTVIVPTVSPSGPDFEQCIRSVVGTNAAQVLVVIVGKAKLADARVFCDQFPTICTAMPEVRTPITILCDDHVFWPTYFLPDVLAPFEDSKVGAVGTVKCVIREHSGFSNRDFWNFIACLYLTRRNFDQRATSAIDNGVSTLSGRTAAFRTTILAAPDFMHEFCNEYFFFGMIGPLNADDDKFTTRWLTNHGWLIKVQDKKTTQPWCVYAVYLTSMVNFALFYDAGLLFSLWMAVRDGDCAKMAMCCLGAWIFCSKLVKISFHFLRYPADLVYLPGYIAFAYFHSLIKLYALCDAEMLIPCAKIPEYGTMNADLTNVNTTATSSRVPSPDGHSEIASSSSHSSVGTSSSQSSQFHSKSGIRCNSDCHKKSD